MHLACSRGHVSEHVLVPYADAGVRVDDIRYICRREGRRRHAEDPRWYQHTSAYVSIRQHTSAYVTLAHVSIRQHTSAYVST